jgi:hypothetical protein
MGCVLQGLEQVAPPFELPFACQDMSGIAV